MGVLTSSAFISTTSAGARLKSTSSAAQIRLASDSTVQIHRDSVRPINGLLQVEGPLRIELGTQRIDVPAGEGRTIFSGKTVAALNPKMGSIHDLQASGRIDFSWPTVSGPAPTSSNSRLEFARDSEFKTILFSETVPATSNLTVDVSDRSPGTWFVRWVSAEETLAVTSIHLVEAKTPDQLRRWGRRWLSWRDRGEASLYRIDFSADQTFQNVAHSFQVRARQFDLTLVPAGKHFARVTSIDLDGGESTSRPLSIDVAEKSEILRASTDLNDPDLKLFARGWRILLNEDEMSRLREGYVILRESELRGIRVANRETAGQIIFEVARDENFSNPERVKPDPQGELLPPALPLGVLFARLRRIDEDGQLGAAGPASRLTTFLPAPKPLPVKTTRLTQPDGESLNGVELRWMLKAPVAGYEVRVSTDSEFSETSTRVMRTREPSRKIAAPGLTKFFWTVSALNQFGQPISQRSKVQEVKIPEAPRLKTVASTKKVSVLRAPAMIQPLRPEPLGPADDAVIVGGARAKTYGKLTWSFNQKTGRDPSSVKTSTFEVQIATDGDFVNVIEKKQVKATEYTLRGDLPEGALFWRVRKSDSKEWSPSRRLELVYE